VHAGRPTISYATEAASLRAVVRGHGVLTYEVQVTSVVGTQRTFGGIAS
jgi:hypothetical protein